MKVLILGLLLALPLSKELGVCFQYPPIMYRIARKEGFYKRGTLPARLHNPGALKYVGQADAIRGERGFARFKRDSVGWLALERQLFLNLKRGVPLRKSWDYL